jgi:imidazolonepropionase
MHVDLFIHSARQLLTVASPGGPKCGLAMRELGLIEDGAVAVIQDRIVAVGTTGELRTTIQADQELDASNCVVLPGFVDAHTHVVFAGDRVAEFEQRIAGATYLEIMAAGGGIMATVRATRAASVEQLVAESRPRLDRMLAYGTTTVEAKTGYGLTTADELKMLAAIVALDTSHPVDLVPTFLGAHAVPAEYADRADDYVDLVVEEMLPKVRNWKLEVGDWKLKAGNTSNLQSPFVDVFCDQGAFSLDQTRRILSRAKELDFPLKVHADEFAALGATGLAARSGATSADHLAVTPDEELEMLAQSATVPVLLPGTTFGLGSSHYANARWMIDQYGLPVALGSDLNPGTCWCESMPFIVALACRALQLTPAEAIVAATLNAAYAVGHGRETGSLEVGKRADLVVLSVPDYRHLAYRFGTNPVASVVKAGQLIVGAGGATYWRATMSRT